MIKYSVSNPSQFGFCLGDYVTQVREWKFPDGCSGVNINTGSLVPEIDTVDVFVDARIRGDQVLELALTMDALKRQFPFGRFIGFIPMFPYGRQDRVCSPGEAHSLRVVAKMINGMGFDVIITLDPHSNVIEGVVDRVHTVDQFELFGSLKNFAEYTFVAPDMGARKKVEEFARKVGAKGVICFDKTRELATGKITGMRCIDDLVPDAKYIVLDDICDKGGTFLMLREYLPKDAHVELVVTHGLFTHCDGAAPLLDVYTKVVSTDSVGYKVDGVDYVEV